MRSALTSTELMLLRCPKQWSQIFVAVHRPATLFSARLASVPTTWSAGSLSFSSGSSSGVSIPAGVTLYIGSSSGARDKGMLRVRASFTTAATGTISIAELGEKTFNLAVNDYLTVVEDFRPGAKFPRYSGGAWYMDYDTAYDPDVSIQNDNYGPLALLGPAAVGFRVGGSCKLKYVGERSAAYSPSNSINAWSWAFPSPGSPSSSTSQGTTASPIAVTYNSVITGGRYHSLRVTENTTAKTHTGYRLTFVFDRSGADAPYSGALLTAISGGPQQGGYVATLAIRNTSASLTDFPDKAHVVIFTEDHFADDNGEYWYTDDVTGTLTATKTVTGATSGATGTLVTVGSGYVQIRTLMGEFIPGESISHTSPSASATITTPNVGGNFPQRTNVLVEGWIIAETVRKNPVTGEIEFTVATIDGLLKTIEGYPMALTNLSTTPTLSWEHYKRTTMNTATLHFVKWRSTLADIVDINFQTDGPPATAIMKYVTLDKATLFEQINGFWQRSMFGWCAADLQSALYFEMDAMIDSTIRAAIPTAFTMAPSTDLRDNLEIPRAAHVDQNAQTVLYAVAYRKPLGSKAPGDPHFYEGVSVEVTEGVVGPLLGGDLSTPDQSTLNTWAGNLRAKANNVYRGVGHQLAGNWRFDVVPQSWFVNSYVAGDTLRGFALASQKWLPRELRMAFNEPSYSLLADVLADAETSGLAGVAISFPKPDPPPAEPPPTPTEPPIVPVVSGDAIEMWLSVEDSAGYHIVWAGDYFSTATSEPGWNLLDLPTDYGIAAQQRVNAWITLGGTALWLSGIDTAHSNRMTIWQLDNLAAIRAAPSTTPSWSIIAYETMTANGFPLTHIGTSPWRVMCVGSTFVARVGSDRATDIEMVGEHDGTSWTWHDCAITYKDNNAPVTLAAILDGRIDGHGAYQRVENYSGGLLGTAFTNLFGGHAGPEFWRRADSAAAIYVPRAYPDSGANTLRLHKHTDGDATDVVSTGVAAAIANGRCSVRGAPKGPQVYFTAKLVISGTMHRKIYLSDDGDTFSEHSDFSGGTDGTENAGFTQDAKLIGGGSLVFAFGTVQPSSVPTWLNPDRAAGAGNWNAKTGNWNTLVNQATQAHIHNMQIVYSL